MLYELLSSEYPSDDRIPDSPVTTAIIIADSVEEAIEKAESYYATLEGIIVIRTTPTGANFHATWEITIPEVMFTAYTFLVDAHNVL